MLLHINTFLFYKPIPQKPQKIMLSAPVIVVEAANKFNCHKFVFLSTDKAVNPANILGATKRAGEIYCEGYEYGFQYPLYYGQIR